MTFKKRDEASEFPMFSDLAKKYNLPNWQVTRIAQKCLNISGSITSDDQWRAMEEGCRVASENGYTPLKVLAHLTEMGLLPAPVTTDVTPTRSFPVLKDALRDRYVPLPEDSADQAASLDEVYEALVSLSQQMLGLTTRIDRVLNREAVKAALDPTLKDQEKTRLYREIFALHENWNIELTSSLRAAVFKRVNHLITKFSFGALVVAVEDLKDLVQKPGFRLNNKSDFLPLIYSMTEKNYDEGCYNNEQEYFTVTQLRSAIEHSYDERLEIETPETVYINELVSEFTPNRFASLTKLDYYTVLFNYVSENVDQYDAAKVFAAIAPLRELSDSMDLITCPENTPRINLDEFRKVANG